MEMFNKIYSQVSNSVSTTVSQLSGVLPGNPVTREFEASNHIASAGPGLSWKIYKGLKRSTKQEASIFVFEKRQLEKYSKSNRDLVLDALKRGVVQLTKIRHPQILTVQHPLEESRESLAFATEPVFSSLANVLGKTKNMPQPGNLSDYKLYDIEVKYGLLQIGQGLAFLHNDMKLLHHNICPENIIINASGVWKLFGFDFCVHNANTSDPNAPVRYPLVQYHQSQPLESLPALDYIDPQCILSNTSTTISTSSDIYSLGIIIYVLHSIGNRPLGGAVSDLSQLRQRSAATAGVPDQLECVPSGLRDALRQMVVVGRHDRRIDAHQFVRMQYFDDVGVNTLNQLDSLLQWDNIQKSQFYRGLGEALAKLPHRVQVQRVLPCLERDLAQPAMVPFVLPSILDIASECTQTQYVQSVLPCLKPVMRLAEPVQVLLILLQRMQLLLRLTPAQDIQQHVLPMLYRGLDTTQQSNASQIHDLCLSVLPTFAALLDHNSVKNHLLPRIKKLCLATSTLSVRVNCLLCVGGLLEHLDRWLVMDDVLPFLPQVPSREPAVLMALLGIYKIALTHKKLGITKEVVAGRVLPFLMPLCIENGLSLAQFNAVVALVKQMVQQVETEHRTKLQQLHSVQEENRHLATMAAATAVAPIQPIPVKSTAVTMDTKAVNKDSLLDFSSAHSHHNIRSYPAPATTPPLVNSKNNNGPAILTSPPVNVNANVSSNRLPFALNCINANLPLPSRGCGTAASAAPAPAFSTNTIQSSNSSWLANVNSTSHNSSGNWTALDNLLPNRQTSGQINLNQMSMSMQQSSPLLLVPEEATLHTSTTLSNDDILDFLK